MKLPKTQPTGLMFLPDVDGDDELLERLGQKFGSWTDDEEDPEGEETEDEEE